MCFRSFMRYTLCGHVETWVKYCEKVRTDGQCRKAYFSKFRVQVKVCCCSYNCCESQRLRLVSRYNDAENELIDFKNTVKEGEFPEHRQRLENAKGVAVSNLNNHDIQHGGQKCLKCVQEVLIWPPHPPNQGTAFKPVEYSDVEKFTYRGPLPENFHYEKWLLGK